MEEKQKRHADELCRISAHSSARPSEPREPKCVSGMEERWSVSLRLPVGKVYNNGDFHSCSRGPLA